MFGLQRCIGFVFLLTISCAGGAKLDADVSQDGVAESNQHEPSRALEYGRSVESNKEMYRALLLDELVRANVELDIVEVDGKTAQQLLSKEGFSKPFGEAFNAYLDALLARRDAKAYFYHIPLVDHAPTGAIFVPWPSANSFKAPPDRPDSPGMFLIFGLGSSSQAEATPSSAVRFQGPSLTPALFEQLAQEGRDFVVFIDSSGCGASDSASAMLREIYEAEKPSVDVYIDAQGAVSGAQLKRINGSMSFPSLIYFKKGQPTDFSLSSNFELRASIYDLFARNHLIKGPRSPLKSPKEAGWGRETWLRRLSVLKHWAVADLSGEELRGVNLSRGSLCGVSLVGAVLDGADLRRAIITHSDLTGASFKGAKLDGVFMYNVTCPNGTSSMAHGHTCPDIATH